MNIRINRFIYRVAADELRFCKMYAMIFCYTFFAYVSFAARLTAGWLRRLSFVPNASTFFTSICSCDRGLMTTTKNKRTKCDLI